MFFHWRSSRKRSTEVKIGQQHKNNIKSYWIMISCRSWGDQPKRERCRTLWIFNPFREKFHVGITETQIDWKTLESILLFIFKCFFLLLHRRRFQLFVFLGLSTTTTKLPFLFITFMNIDILLNKRNISFECFTQRFLKLELNTNLSRKGDKMRSGFRSWDYPKNSNQHNCVWCFHRRVGSN